MLLLFQKRPLELGGSRLGLKTGNKSTVYDLLYGLMLCSGNDAAVSLAEHVGGSVDGFLELMNKKAIELNLKNTHFETPHGLDKDEHFTTAYELALLTNYALNNKIFSQIVETKLTTINISGYSKSIHNSNELLGNLSGIYGVKTGFTNGANRCLVSACKRNGMDIICIVLGADTKTFRTKDSIKLIEYAFSNFSLVNFSEIARNKFDSWKASNDINSFEIEKSPNKSDDFNIVKGDDFNKKDVIIPIKISDIDKLSADVFCNKVLDAPISSGSSIGNISVTLNDNTLYTSDILVSSDIYRKGFFSFFLELLKKIRN